MPFVIWRESDGAMLTSNFYYDLPESLIAQAPPKERGTSRMLVLHRDSGEIEHRRIGDILEYISPRDVIVFNNTRVFSARIFGRWSDSPGRVEVLFVEPSSGEPGVWSALCRSSRPMRPGAEIVLADGAMSAVVAGRGADGQVLLEVHANGDFFELLDKFGVPPVPPYIKRGREDARTELDRERYQTVYASKTGAVAAPTAGLHFSDALLKQIGAKGTDIEFVTLHVGPGTFRPVKTERVEDHNMDSERYEIPACTAEAVTRVAGSGGRVFAVGSTTVRTLETCAAENGGKIVPCRGRSSAFIYPPYKFMAVDAMLTNFHLPCSTLIMMVCALAGRENVMRAYREAVRERYMFYSYGDCMLII